MRFKSCKYVKIRLWPGFRPGPCWGAYSAPHTLYLDLRREGKGRRRRGGEGKEKGGQRRRGEGPIPPNKNPGCSPGARLLLFHKRGGSKCPTCIFGGIFYFKPPCILTNSHTDTRPFNAFTAIQCNPHWKQQECCKKSVITTKTQSFHYNLSRYSTRTSRSN